MSTTCSFSQPRAIGPEHADVDRGASLSRRAIEVNADARRPRRHLEGQEAPGLVIRAAHGSFEDEVGVRRARFGRSRNDGGQSE
jgi:hypothetical protein